MRKKGKNMIPNYNPKPLTEERMTKRAMVEALEREDVAVSVGTARQTCLGIVRLKDCMRTFEEELCSDPYFKGKSAWEVADSLFKDVDEILRNKESALYRKEHLTSERTIAAMSQVGIMVEVDLMESLLVAYAVGNKELLAQEWKPYLEENNITADSVEAVAMCY